MFQMVIWATWNLYVWRWVLKQLCCVYEIESKPLNAIVNSFRRLALALLNNLTPAKPT